MVPLSAWLAAAIIGAGMPTVPVAPVEASSEPEPVAHAWEAGGLSLSISPAAPVLGLEQEVVLHIRPVAPWPNGRPSRVEVHANGGQIEDVSPEGEDGFSARWVLPTRRAPRGVIAVARAETDPPQIGALHLPLPAVASPAFFTDPGAEVSMQVAGRRFGPKRANARGEVRVPIVVPPGVSIALAHSKNAHGKLAEETVELGVPPFEKALLLAPEVAEQGRPAEAWLFTSDERGRPGDERRFALFASGRRAQPLESGAGFVRYLFTPPTHGQETHVELTVYELGDGRALAPDEGPPPRTPVQTVKIGLLPGPPSRLVMLPDRSAMVVGSAQRLSIVIRAEDAWGHATNATGTRVYVNGEPSPAILRPDGRLHVVLRAPDERPPSERLTVEAIDGVAYGRLDVPLHAPVVRRRAPAPIAPEAQAWGLLARLGPVMNFGGGVSPSAHLELQVQPLRWAAWPRGLFVTAALSYLGRYERLESASGLSTLRVHAAPLLVGPTWRLHLRRQLDLFLQLAAGVARLVADNDGYGAPVGGHGWTSAWRFGAEVVLGGGPTQLAFGASFFDIAGTRLSSQDDLRGNLGGLGVSLGARRRW